MRPAITSNGGGATAAVSVAENTTAVTTVTATDADAGATLTYTIAGGADAARFTINATTGVLSFVSAPDFEAPTDAGGQQRLRREVQVSDGTNTDTQDIAVTVDQRQRQCPGDHVERRRGRGCGRVAENTTAVTTVTATDADAGATLTYTIAGGADAARFTIDAATGVLPSSRRPTSRPRPMPAANNVYDVTVQVSDGTNTDTQDIAVTVTDVNDNAPTITSNGGGAALRSRRGEHDRRDHGDGDRRRCRRDAELLDRGRRGRGPVHDQRRDRRAGLRLGPRLRGPDRCRRPTTSTT